MNEISEAELQLRKMKLELSLTQIHFSYMMRSIIFWISFLKFLSPCHHKGMTWQHGKFTQNKNKDSHTICLYVAQNVCSLSEKPHMLITNIFVRYIIICFSYFFLVVKVKNTTANFLYKCTLFFLIWKLD